MNTHFPHITMHLGSVNTALAAINTKYGAGSVPTIRTLNNESIGAACRAIQVLAEAATPGTVVNNARGYRADLNLAIQTLDSVTV